MQLNALGAPLGDVVNQYVETNVSLCRSNCSARGSLPAVGQISLLTGEFSFSVHHVLINSFHCSLCLKKDIVAREEKTREPILQYKVDGKVSFSTALQVTYRRSRGRA